MTVAPYVRHQNWERAVLEASAPEWAPSPEVILLFHLEGTQDLNEWLRDKNRGFCDRCWAPLEWQKGYPQTTCSSKCRKRRERDTKERREWRKEHAFYELIGKMDDIPYDDWERQERHKKLQAVREDTYKPPKRLGHAMPRYDQADSGLQKDAHTTFSSVESMQWHDKLILRQGSSKDQKADKLADAWLDENEPLSD